VPQVATRPDRHDRLGAFLTRLGPIRNRYTVVPGLYAVGTPTAEAPVLVTANYKLSFDALRFALTGLDAWLLVVDTRGVNVWCAAGKGTFSTEEIIHSARQARLADITSHRRLILPQLGATGVSAAGVRKGCGFSVVYGPIRTDDLPVFLKEGNTAGETMRTATFPLKERLVLIPVELYLLLKPLALIMIAGFVISGVSPEVFSLSAAWQRGLLLLVATVIGMVCGSVLVPALLPWLPGRQFWVKGLWPGLLAGTALFLSTAAPPAFLDQSALLLWIVAVSSFQAMNFTGCTPYTSPSGVEFEMRRGVPLQLLLVVTAMALWLASPFFSA